MSSGEELLLAGVRPLASAFRARVLGGGARAAARRAVEAVGLGSGVPLRCARRFINRRPLRGEGHGHSGAGRRLLTQRLRNRLMADVLRWRCQTLKVSCLKAKRTTSPS